MSPRSIRRAAERKQRKLERKQARAAAANPMPAPAADPLECEFSPNLIAQARAARERIHARLAAHRGASQSEPELPAPPPRSRAEINRANALHSTGPGSPDGKLASSRNSLKHGLASGTLIIPGEDLAAFDALLQTLLAEHQPASPTEELLVRQIAQSHWLEQRAIRLQNECFTANGIDEKRLALFLRYQTTHQRAFYKALQELTRLQKQRRQISSGFVSQKAAGAPSEPGFVSQHGATIRRLQPDTLAEGAVTALNQIDQVPHQL